MENKTTCHSLISTDEKVKLLVERLEEKKACNVVAMDLRGLTPVAEAMVVATACNPRHAQGAADGVMDKAAEARLEVLGMEGYRNAQWILLDLNDVLVHIFQEDVRQAVNMEGLWSGAGTIFRSVGDPGEENMAQENQAGQVPEKTAP